MASSSHAVNFNTQDKFLVVGLEETYANLGIYEFKIVLNPYHYKHGKFCTLELLHADGKPYLKQNYEIWGRKINIKFEIDNSVADGVSYVNLFLRQEENEDFNKQVITFWVIKP